MHVELLNIKRDVLIKNKTVTEKCPFDKNNNQTSVLVSRYVFQHLLYETTALSSV